MITETGSASANDFSRQAMEMVHKAMQSGIQFQADSARQFTGMFGEYSWPADWGKNVQDGVARELWESALTALRTNTQAVLQANARTLNYWAELADNATRLIGEGAKQFAACMERVNAEATDRPE